MENLNQIIKQFPEVGEVKVSKSTDFRADLTKLI